MVCTLIFTAAPALSARTTVSRSRHEDSIRANGDAACSCSATPNFQLQSGINSNQHTQVVPVIS